MALGVGPNDYTWDPVAGAFKRLGGQSTTSVAAGGGGSTPSSTPQSPFIPQRYTTATRPAPGTGTAGRIVRVKDDGAPEELQVCLQQSNGGFEWVTLAITSS